MSRRPVIAIVGSGETDETDMSNARELGRLVAERGCVLITGGRDAGVMKAANEGAKLAKESLTIGILPDGDTKVSPFVDIAIVTETGEARNNIIVLSADVVIACGVDDPGTVSEVALALKAGKPVILLNSDAAAVEFFRSLGGDGIHVADSSDQAVEIAWECVTETGAKKE